MKKTILILTISLLLVLGVLAFASCDNSVTNPDADIPSEAAQNHVNETVVDMPTDDISDIDTEIKGSEADQYCVIHYDCNGGQGFIGDMTLKVGATLTLPDKGYSKSLYRFVGFSRTAESTSPEFSLGACYTATSNEQVTLYAVYEDNSASLKICKTDADTFGDEANIVLEKGKEYRLPEPPFSKDYSIFMGYSRNPNSETPEYFVGDYVFISNDMTLYALFKPMTYKLIIEPQNGETRVAFDLPHGEVTLDERFTSTKIGHSLLGFSTSKDSDDIIYQLNDTVTLEHDLVLYAVYEPVLLQISFVIYDDCSMDPICFRFGDTITVPAYPFEKPYYKFLGYSIEGPDSIMIKYTPGQEISPTTDLNLYPVWGLKTTVKRGLTQSVRISGDYVAKVDFSEVLDVSALYEAGYVNYRVTVEWQTSKIKGHKARGDLQLFRSYPDSNYNPFDFSGSTIDKFNTKYRILNKDDFSIGQSLEISTPYRSTAEILDEQAFFIHFLSTGSSWIDVIDNDYRLESCVVTLEFFQ